MAQHGADPRAVDDRARAGHSRQIAARCRLAIGTGRHEPLVGPATVTPLAANESHPSCTAAAQGATGADVALGLYDCSFFSMSTGLQPTPGLNISITGPGRYTDASGHSGTYLYDPPNRMVTMVGGDVGGEHLIYGSGPDLNYLTDDGETFWPSAIWCIPEQTSEVRWVACVNDAAPARQPSKP